MSLAIKNEQYHRPARSTPTVSSARRIAVLLLKLAVTIGVLGWLLAKVELGTVLATVRKVPLLTLMIAMVLVAAQPLIAAIRWHFILRCLNAPVSIVRTLQIYWIGLFASCLLPGGIVGDGVRMWMLTRAGTRVSSSVNSVLLDRTAALVGLFLIVAASLPFADNRVADAPIRYGAAILLVAVIAVAFTIGICIRLPERWQRFRAARAVSSISKDLRSVCVPAQRAIGLTCVSALAIACNSLSIFILVRSLGPPIGLLDTMTLAPLVILAATLPISLGGWGLREGSTVGLFWIIGVAPAVSLSASILIGLLSTAVSLPGALVWLQWRRARSVSAPENSIADRE